MLGIVGYGLQGEASRGGKEEVAVIVIEEGLSWKEQNLEIKKVKLSS